MQAETHATSHANTALLFIYGVLLTLFVLRFIRQRRVRSLSVALLASGWVLVALEELDVLDRFALHAVKGIGAVLGLALLFMLLVGMQRVRPEPPGEKPEE